MFFRRPLAIGLVLSVLLASITACESLPGNKKEQGAVIGGVGGAVAGAALGGENRLIGALIGGALGAGGGYLIGAQMDKTDPKENHDEAVQAAQKAEANPAQPEDVKNSTTADLNHDGYVTLDEVVAMKRAGLTDDQMIQRIRATKQVFELTPQQQQYLRDRGVSNTVINAMLAMTPPATQPTSSQLNMGNERISQ